MKYLSVSCSITIVAFLAIKVNIFLKLAAFSGDFNEVLAAVFTEK